MKNSRLFKRMINSSGARALTMMAVILLALEPCVFAFTQVVSKYPSGTPTISSVDMDPGAGVNTLYYGSVFGFNSAKSAADTNAAAELREGACVPETTSYTFMSGLDGWVGKTTNPQFPGGADATTKEAYMYDTTWGTGSLKTTLATRNVTEKFTWEKKFFYDCGTPSTVTFALKYSRGTTWNLPGATNNFQVQLFKPSDTTYAAPVTLVASTNITATSLTNTPGTITTANLNELGTYTLRIVGTLSTVNTPGATVEVVFDDVNLAITPQTAYTSFQMNVEMAMNGTPLSAAATNQYLLEIRAKKIAGDSETTNVQVCQDALPTCGTWTTRYSYLSTDTAWTTKNTYYLTTAEYNNGNVRVRYVDATPAGDNSMGGLDVEYQRVTVDQGVCVDQVTDSTADCGKCHNYGTDVTKPWPNQGMHSKHVQTESVSDCLWCHPNNGTDSAHKDGALKIAGTKVYRSTDTNLNGAPAAALYNADKTCSNIDCHKNLTTPAWDSVEGVGGFYPNCSRCHNTTGTKAADAAGNLNVDSAWPNDAGGGHSKHDIAFNLTQTSCQTNGSCHPDNTSKHSVVGDGKVEVKMASAFTSPNKIPKYIPDTTNGTGTCVNMACHGGQQTPRFNLASTNPIDVPTQCTACHIAEKADGWGTAAGMATQWNSPITGLHRGSPPTSGKSHISDYGCTQCHNEPAKHFITAGVSNLSDTTMDSLTPADFKAVVGYAAGTGTSPNYTTPPTCSNPNPTTGCHAESDTTYRNPATTWARKWSWDAYDTVTPANQCKNCHGHWNSFVSGVVAPHGSKGASGGVLQLNHSDSGVNCATMCHGQTATGYNHGVAMTATTKDMTLNSSAGPVDNGDNVGCSGCHTSNDGTAAQATTAGKHIFADATWVTQNNVVGPAPDCLAASCHGASATLNKGLVSSGGDFSMTRKHLSGTAVKEQCSVCHDSANQPMNTASLKRDKIQLKNPDTGATIEIDQALADTNATRNTNFVTFCSKCHDAGGATVTFRATGTATNPFGTGATPKDIDAKYNSTITALTHNYGNNAVPQLTKARSPHGKPATNTMKGTNQTTYTDVNPVGCQSCHPSHGGDALNPLPVITGGTDINATAIQGRMMKAGYSEPGSCWTCHNSAGVKDYYGDVIGGGANWVGKQNSAFAYKQRNYWSAHQVLQTPISARAGAQVTAAEVANTKVACSICHDPHGASSWNGTSGSVSYYSYSLRGTWLTSPYPEDRAGKKNSYESAIWARTAGASLYTGPRSVTEAAYNKPPNWGHGYGTSGGTGHEGWFLDENTLGVTGAAATSNIVISRLAETDASFAGLCANCHAGSLVGGTTANMQTYLKNTARGATGWSATSIIHQTVKGWGTTASVDKVNTTNNNHRMHLYFGTTAPTGTGPYGYQSGAYTRSRGTFAWGVDFTNGTAQKYHEFSCSKCHTPHASSLPRLLITNCLDVGSSTTARTVIRPTVNNTATAGAANDRYTYTYPTYATSNVKQGSSVQWPNGQAWWLNGTTSPLVNPNEAAIHCHNRGTNNKTAAPTGGWNTLTGW